MPDIIHWDFFAFRCLLFFLGPWVRDCIVSSEANMTRMPLILVCSICSLSKCFTDTGIPSNKTASIMRSPSLLNTSVWPVATSLMYAVCNWGLPSSQNSLHGPSARFYSKFISLDNCPFEYHSLKTPSRFPSLKLWWNCCWPLSNQDS